MFKNLVIVFLVLILLGGAAFGTLVYLGIVHLTPPKVAVVERKPPEGTVAVPMSVRRIPIYHRITREDLLDSDTGKPITVFLKVDENSRTDNTPLVRNSDILGRVLKHTKEPGYVFTESDFYPKGTEPGDAAGVPPGKRAITIEVSKVAGLRALVPGNHIDMVAAQVVDPKANTAKFPPIADPNAVPPGSVKRAVFKPLVQDGVVVTPVTIRQVPYMNSSTSVMSSGQQSVRYKPVEEILIAVDVDEVGPLTEALAAGADINCFLHSGQPMTGPATQAVIPADAPATALSGHVVEKVVGKKHDMVYTSSATLPRASAPLDKDDLPTATIPAATTGPAGGGAP